MLSGRYLRPGSEIKGSPMVDENAQIVLFTGMSYTF
ncbi:MltA-interacting protein precursor [Erwinia amylovora Ea644]|nr:MltA-interacting protein precursor [Erwinia amylovora Ea644]